MLPFVWNIFKSYRYGEVVVVDDPWGYGNSLEWVTTCPPPRHNFTELPRIRSERPAFELHYPHMADRMRAEAHVGRQRHSNLATESAHAGRTREQPLRRMSTASTCTRQRRGTRLTKDPLETQPRHAARPTR